MKKIENYNFVELKDSDLMELEGGSFVVAVGGAAGLTGIFLGGRTIGQDLKRKFG